MYRKEVVVRLLIISVIFIGFNFTLRSVQAQTCEYDPYPVLVCDSYPVPVDQPATSTPRPTSVSTPALQATFTPIFTPTFTPIVPTPTRLVSEQVERRLYLPSIFIKSDPVESNTAASVHLIQERTVGQKFAVWWGVFMIGLGSVTVVYKSNKKQR